MVKTCSDCKGKMKEYESKTPEGITYNYYKCEQCGEEILSMEQLHRVAEKYRLIKKYNVKLTKWGESIGLRIPKEITKKYNFKLDEEVIIIPEDKGIKFCVIYLSNISNLDLFSASA